MMASCSSGSDAKTEVNSAPTKIQKPETLHGSWKLNKVDLLNGLSEEEAKKEIVKYQRNGMMLSFFPDNILTKVDGQKYTSTTWNFNGLKSAVSVGKVIDGREDKFSFGLDDLALTSVKGAPALKIKNDKGVFTFRKVGDPMSKLEDDPFHPINNQWRVIAPKSETYAQMKKRLLNYTEHNLALFKAAKERGKDKVVNGNSIGIYVYYDGAIKIVDGGKVPSAWMANFYSPEEAMDAWGFANEYFKSGFIRKKHPDGFIASGEVIFEQLIEKMKKKGVK